MSFLNKLCKNNTPFLKCTFKHLNRSCMSSSNNNNNKNYDIIIVGGGMIGLTLGCSLARNCWLSNKRILILELGSKPNYKINNTSYSNRVVSLNEQTKCLLTSIGSWKNIENTRFKTVKQMLVWEACSDALLEFNHPDLSQPISYIVENNLLLSSLNEQIENIENVDIEYNTKIQDLKLPLDAAKDKPQILKEDGSSYTCELLIGADGFRSKVREAMGVQNFTWDYKQLGIVATLQLSEPTENVVAWQRFLPTGPIALLPLTDELSSLVWSADEKEAKRLLALPEDQFVDAVNDAFWRQSEKALGVEEISGFFKQLFGGRASGAVRQLPPSIKNLETGSRAAFPLGLGHATRYIQPSTVIIGDAAHRMHPLAGQGVNLGFGDVESLTRHLAEAVSRGERLGDIHTLAEFETERQRHNISLLAATHGLQALYSSTFTPVVLARSLGVHFTNSIQPLKKALMNHASH